MMTGITSAVAEVVLVVVPASVVEAEALAALGAAPLVEAVLAEAGNSRKLKLINDIGRLLVNSHR